MHSLNPYLRAFFKSALPTQCSPVKNHILLVPTTECLLTGKDRETNSSFADLAGSEDFLASHVLRISGPANPGSNNVRDSRGKAKQFNTVNGRTIVVKESFVYSNKGFRNLNQAQLLSDQLYYPDSLDAQQWLIYYISRPLVGSYEPIKITPALLPNLLNGLKASTNTLAGHLSGHEDSQPSSSVKKKDIRSFNDLLNNFPMIARQMQPGLEKVFKDFNKEMQDRPSTLSRKSSNTSRRSSTASSQSRSNGSIRSRYSNGHPAAPSIATLRVDEEEDHMRKTLETAVTASIDLFQQVDKQQLSLLGATTDLTGPTVERIIERYVTEQVHDSTLFPVLRNSRRLEDLELESRIHQMQHIDIAQVGIEIEDGRKGKEQMMARLAKGVEEFRKLGVAGSPQQMTEILLATQKVVTSDQPIDKKLDSAMNDKMGVEASEKPPSSMTMNADTLVSLLLVVVIRSQVRHLQARLTYMRNFIFVDDIESGEIGYALSTFEAVLSYLASDSGGLRKASRRNKRLWQAARGGDIKDLKAILDPGPQSILNEDGSSALHEEANEDVISDGEHDSATSRFVGMENTRFSDHRLSTATTEDGSSSENSNLAHVFPFEALKASRKGKHVSMDMRSLSNASESSFISRTTTVDSKTSIIEGDTSIATLAQTQDADGNSVLMMVVESRQPEALEYLLSLEEYFPSRHLLEDSNKEGTTLLSAAVQLAHTELIDMLLRGIFRNRDTEDIVGYFARADRHGRTVAHYFFNAPFLIPQFSDFLPWRRKDKNGQTPLLALCRSYDHTNYAEMVNDALQFATHEQDDGQPLHLDDHVDAKGNTLLHVVNDPSLALRILRHCDSDPNATNDKRFTPLMVASKYGRMDMVRALFSDQRVDVLAKETRGMTAVELAKDDEIRNRIDDMVLVSNVPAADGRVTAVVRSFFVEDASIRLIIKSAVRNDNGMIGVTTCRRSLTDFENLAKWLSVEHPASWLPSIFNFRSPYQIASRPSRAVLQDIQVRLDKFLTIMLAHSTFSTHELLWEFVLFPEIQPDMMAERSRKKAELRSENIREDYEPVEDVRDVSTFVEHARESIRGINHSTKSVIRRVASVRIGSSNLSIAMELCAKDFSTLAFLPPPYITALSRFTACTQLLPSDPHKLFHQDMQAISSTILAILSSLARPHSLINSLVSIQKAVDRHDSSLRRSDRWPLGLLDETRKGIHADAQEKAEKSREELRTVGCELTYTQQTVAGELAGWQELHAKLGRRAIRALAERMVVREKDRLESMKRAVRGVVDVQKKRKTFTLNTGDKIPAIGLGTWQSKPNEVRDAVRVALAKGYRHIDTALAYGNEHEVGQGIKDSGVPREAIWLTTKLDNDWHHRVGEGIDSSLKSLGTDYVDLYLIHWPSSTDPKDKSKHLPDWDFIKTWQEMQKLPATGKVRNIGVSNFGLKNLEKLLNDPSCKTVPAVNQIELHPNNPSPKLVAYNNEKGIHCTGYSCLGSTNSPLYKDPTLLKMAEEKGKTPQQVLLMWGLQHEWSVIPKSVSQARIEKNFELDGWDLSTAEMKKLDELTDRFKVCGDGWLPVKVFFGDDE